MIGYKRFRYLEMKCQILLNFEWGKKIFGLPRKILPPPVQTLKMTVP